MRWRLAEADYRVRREVQQAQAELDRLVASRAPAGPPSVATAPASPLDLNTVEVGTELGVNGELLRLLERLAGLVDRRELLRLGGVGDDHRFGCLDQPG
jgi:hypothetical protein